MAVARVDREMDWESSDFADSLAAAFSGKEHRNTGDISCVNTGDGLWLHLTYTHPKSAKGKHCRLYLDDSDIEALFKHLRSRMIQRRSEPMSKPS